MSSLFEVRKKYNFSVYPSDILGNNFKQVIVEAIVNPSIAAKFLDIEAFHVQVYPYLPAGIPNDPRGYDYLMFKTASGQTTILGIPWIKQDSVVLAESGTIFVEIPNVTTQDLTRVSDALSANGFYGFNVKMKE